MKSSYRPMRLLKKIIKKFSPRYQHNELLNNIQQLANEQSVLKQFIQYRTQEVENSHAIHMLKLRLFLKQTLNKPEHINARGDKGYQKAKPKLFADYLNDLEKLSPDVFNVWETCFKTGQLSYMEEREHSCSTSSNLYANAFHAFIATHACGRLLDQGCGIYGLPSYLDGYPLDLISAIEPLLPVVVSDFELVRGFAWGSLMIFIFQKILSVVPIVLVV